MQSPRKRSFAAEELARRKQKKPWLWIVAVVVVIVLIAGGYALYQRSLSQKRVEPETRNIKSIAVLPLKNMIGDPEQLYFTDGMHDALINNLSKIGALRVISNTSVMQYRDNPKPIPVIAQELDVDAVIEGSVFRADNQVRIIVQLIATNPERHLWSNEYTRELRNVMSLQNEVAQAIAGEIRITVTPEEKERLVSAYPVNPEAYDYYLRGNDYYNRGNEEDDMRIAVQMYQKVVELDTTYALAYAKLSQTQSRMYFWRYDRSEKCLTEAKEHADKALQLNPDLPEAYLALGYYYYFGRMDFNRALDQFAIARESQPNNSALLEVIGYVQRRQGKFEEALANLRKASELDPLSSIIALGVAETYEFLRNIPEAERYIDRAISLAPDNPSYIATKALICLYGEGSTEKARAVLKEESKNFNAALDYCIGWFISYPFDVYDGNYQKALDQLSRLSSYNFDTHYYFIPIAQLYAKIYGLLNNAEFEKAYYDSARVILEARKREQPDDARFHSSLGIVYAGLGRKEEAIKEGKQAVAMRPVSKEALAGIRHVENLARIYVKVGEYGNAIDQLEFLLSRPGVITTHVLRLDPDWAPLRNHPRFRELLEKYAVKNN